MLLAADVLKNMVNTGTIGILAIVIILVLATVIGVFRKTYMSIWDAVIFITLFIVSYFVFVPKLGLWICDKSILQFGLNTTIMVNNIKVYEINNFTDLVGFFARVSNDARLTNEYIANLAAAITYAMACAVMAIGVLIASPIISLITWPIINLMIKKKANVYNRRFVGPIVALVEALFVIIFVINCFGAYSDGMRVVISNSEMLLQLNIPNGLIYTLKCFSVDIVGFFKFLNLHMINFKFAANGTTYSLSTEFNWLVHSALDNQTTETLSASLLERWALDNGVSVPVSQLIKINK